ncbi:Crp/Fnr family transcriptional regulator [Atopomonas sediminilitoris]|uniref:Crp/Fnr family transcriptional regulator n=1 Tax=Atopomonas sediminilitoris TaxID=2919919 RepID=UPI001F4D3A37|nr:Crp/Fnr family transcriptional regulator [Atopomonas sediminilitoris]MCJ8170824.1 Crp/Fnr family transcriptional regulator [Atopomonas sediminilitoris]
MLTDPYAINQIRQHYLFAKLPDAAFNELCKTALLRHVDSNQPLFQQGEPAERFYLVLKGQVKLLRLLPEGQEKLVEVIPTGHTFAEALMFSGIRQYPVSASTMQACTLVSIDSSNYRRLLEDQPAICFDILAHLSLRLHQRLQEIDTLTLANAGRRVARYLCHEQAQNPGPIQLNAPKRLIASRLGIQPETFSRILHRLIDAGLIVMDRRRIDVVDAHGLAHYCE